MAENIIPFEVNNENLRRSFIKELVPLSVSSLTVKHKPQWGIMTAQHMVEHLIWTFAISTGNIKATCKKSKEDLKKVRAFIRSNTPMPREYKMPLLGDKMPELKYPNLAEAQKALNKYIDRFYTYYEKNPKVTHTNPGFGDLNFEEWEYIHFKHCYHHLLQFSLIQDGVDVKGW